MEQSEIIKAGSLPENTIYLPYKGVSRNHFVIECGDGAWKIRDLDSRNGTIVNGKKIKEAPLKAGDVVKIGIVQLTVEPSQEHTDIIPLSDSDAGDGDRSTDEISSTSEPVTSQAGAQEVFYFPRLNFPPEMIPGRSPQMFSIYQQLHSIVDSDVNVLLVGETGVGKEVIAQTIHLSGKRHGEPFVAVNCAAIPEDLAEAELFGIGEKVATNVGKRTGKMALAHRGTLFLDELSAFPFPLQAKILRAVEDKLVYPVGENTPARVDFRVVATSNEEPAELIESGNLRQDLYHRLSTVEIHIPPLRDRKEDILPLVKGLAKLFSEKEGKRLAGLSRAFAIELQNYHYPGNVRELVNIVRSAVAQAHPGSVLGSELLPEKVLRSNVFHATECILQENEAGAVNLHSILDETSRKLIQHALEVHQGNLTRAAQYLNITPRGIRKMMQRLGISRPTDD